MKSGGSPCSTMAKRTMVFPLTGVLPHRREPLTLSLPLLVLPYHPATLCPLPSFKPHHRRENPDTITDLYRTRSRGLPLFSVVSSPHSPMVTPHSSTKTEALQSTVDPRR
ncbi:hypothetical protein AALP_AA8G183800 [Arabis alpina]|uniref:Uncharacterized protein n=1 Tax=Arabis alpina TaxID=50452 RepID=A0A087G7U7_ARAAL|nr:hypothetical protein AALP_AA8G183800 [Arabis alpina]